MDIDLVVIPFKRPAEESSSSSTVEGFVRDDDAPKPKKAKKDLNAPKINKRAIPLYIMSARADVK